MSNNQVQDYIELIKMASDKIAKLEAELDDVKSKEKSESQPIAIIGMGCRINHRVTNYSPGGFQGYPFVTP